MSIAMIAPGAVMDQGERGASDIVFSGRFGFGMDRWAYLPFDVPSGVQRLRVATSYDHF